MQSGISGGRTVMAPREGYEEPVDIPACPAGAVEAAIAEPVRQGNLWLLNGPASFQGEQLPAGVLTPAATLRAPLDPLPVQRLMPDAAPDAWQAGEATVLALSVALAGHPIPWAVLRRAVNDAIASRWLETTPASGTWPCEVTGAAAVTLKPPVAFDPHLRRTESLRATRGIHVVRGAGSRRPAGPGGWTAGHCEGRCRGRWSSGST